MGKIEVGMTQNDHRIPQVGPGQASDEAFNLSAASGVFRRKQRYEEIWIAIEVELCVGV
jgi:hypothetical protein